MSRPSRGTGCWYLENFVSCKITFFCWKSLVGMCLLDKNEHVFMICLVSERIQSGRGTENQWVGALTLLFGYLSVRIRTSCDSWTWIWRYEVYSQFGHCILVQIPRLAGDWNFCLSIFLSPQWYQRTLVCLHSRMGVGRFFCGDLIGELQMIAGNLGR